MAHWVEDSVDCLLTGKTPVVQVRRRDANTKKVVIEERKYEVEERQDGPTTPPAAITHAGRSERDVADGITTSVFDSMFGYSTGGFGNSFGYAGETQFNGVGGKNEDPYAWAARLRDVPEEEALAELASMGFTSDSERGGGRRGDKFSFASGTGSSGKTKKHRRNSVGRGAQPYSARRR